MGNSTDTDTMKSADDANKGAVVRSEWARDELDHLRRGARRDALDAALSFHKERADINNVTASSIAETAKTFETYLTGGSA